MDDDAAIILLSFDTLSPLQLTPYGNIDAETPLLDELLKRADVYYEFHAQPGVFAESRDRLAATLQNAGIESDRLVVDSGDAIERTTIRPRSFMHVELVIGSAPSVDAVDILIESALAALDPPGNCWWIITANRGGDLSQWQDLEVRFGEAFTESLTRKLWAPLIVISPDPERTARRHQELLTSADLIPTVCEILRISQPEWSTGISIVDRSRQPRSELLLLAETHCGLRTPDRLLVTPRELLAATSESEFSTEWPRLFVKPDDRFDVNNLAVNEPQRAADLLARLQVLFNESRANG
ncbi:hypothetical protein [Rubinisphaera margarita]|uniref:hypothetical protein n=1 Tax=Rubinisphaera margarita TaxID=2909586 RepID=UPI001EE8C64A|nr:hypothetical protein [Rubinisphaera margarita]MCG6157892.1 hypothetical protein [Rubinisphaera margarita]